MVQAFIWENTVFLTVMLDTFLSSEYMFIYLESQLREEEIYFFSLALTIVILAYYWAVKSVYININLHLLI